MAHTRMMHCKKKIIRFLFLLGGLSLGLSAESGERDIKTLRVWDFKNTEERTIISMTRVDRLFLEDHPDLRLDHRGFYDQEYIPALKAALLAGSGPDVIWLHSGSEFTEHVSYLEPLASYGDIQSLEIQPLSLEACCGREGLLMALPLTFQGIGWYYNKAIFSQAGLDPDDPPADWEEFLQACEVLKEQGIIPIATGNNRPLTKEFMRRCLLCAFFSDEELEGFYHGAWGPRTSRFQSIMMFLKGLRDKEFLDPVGIFRSYFHYGAESFGTGQSAMILGLISDTLNWKQFSDSLGRDNIGYFPNLIHPDMARPGVQLLQPAGILVGINNRSDLKEEAFAYITHLFSEESRGILSRELGMMIPTKKLVLPEEDYPVLKEIERSLERTALDPELFVPTVRVGVLQYRLDDLLINTKEITVDDYIQKLIKELQFY